MSPALPVVSAREVVRALEKVGFVQRASGEPRKTPERCWQTVIVRLRRELVRGALASILRQSGVSVGSSLMFYRRFVTVGRVRAESARSSETA